MELIQTIDESTKSGQQIAKEANAITKQLEELMQNEYKAMSFMQEIRNDSSENSKIGVVLEIVKNKSSKKEYLDAEMKIMDSFISIERYAFKQGFMRGVAATMGDKA